jgi:hypothetical protein
MNATRNRWAARGLVITALLGVVQTAHAVSPPVEPSGAATPSAAQDDVWPKPVDQFLAGKYLQRSDIVLTRRDWDFASFMIRWATDSPFSHAALVFTGPEEPGITNTFVIEAGTDGVDITNLRDYLEDKSSFVAIKRYNGSWFDPAKQSRVRGVLLDQIKASYNYWAIGRIARDIWFGVENTVQTKEKTIEEYREKDWTPPSEYICSGLVQLGFVETALELIREGQLPPGTIKDVVFHKVAESRLPEAEDWSYFDDETAKTVATIFRDQHTVELESVTPDDLARSEKLDWLYYIEGGLVHKVSTYDEVRNRITQ